MFLRLLLWAGLCINSIIYASTVILDDEVSFEKSIIQLLEQEDFGESTSLLRDDNLILPDKDKRMSLSINKHKNMHSNGVFFCFACVCYVLEKYNWGILPDDVASTVYFSGRKDRDEHLSQCAHLADYQNKKIKNHYMLKDEGCIQCFLNSNGPSVFKRHFIEKHLSKLHPWSIEHGKNVTFRPYASKKYICYSCAYNMLEQCNWGKLSIESIKNVFCFETLVDRNNHVQECISQAEFSNKVMLSKSHNMPFDSKCKKCITTSKRPGYFFRHIFEAHFVKT